MGTHDLVPPPPKLDAVSVIYQYLYTFVLMCQYLSIYIITRLHELFCIGLARTVEARKQDYPTNICEAMQVVSCPPEIHPYHLDQQHFHLCFCRHNILCSEKIFLKRLRSLQFNFLFLVQIFLKFNADRRG